MEEEKVVPEEQQQAILELRAAAAPVVIVEMAVQEELLEMEQMVQAAEVEVEVPEHQVEVVEEELYQQDKQAMAQAALEEQTEAEAVEDPFYIIMHKEDQDMAVVVEE
jgi:hypothetical protein